MDPATTKVPSSWVATIDRVAARVFGLLSLVLIAIWLPSFHEQGWWNVAIAGLVAGAAAWTSSGRTDRVGRAVVATAVNVALAMAVLLCLQLSHDLDPAFRARNPAFPILAIALMATALVLRARVVPVLVTAGLYLVGMVVIVGGGLLPTLDELFATTGACVMLALLVDGFRHAAGSADVARDAALDSERAAADQAAQARAMEERRRLLHDEVLSTLTTIERAAHLDVDEVRELSAAQSVALRGAARGNVHSDDLAEMITHELDAATTLEIGTDVDSDFDPVGVPTTVLAALVGAGAEALRNVERHAGVDRAEVTVSGNVRDGIVVEVLDHGVGIHPARAEGFGLRSSVRGRMAEVGGEAEISSSARHGTRVRLRWQPTPTSLASVSRPASVQALLRRNEGIQRLIFWMAVAGCSGQFWMAIRYPATGAMLWPSIVFTVAMTGFYLLVALRVSRGLIPFVEHIAIQVLLWTSLVVGLWVAGPGALQ